MSNSKETMVDADLCRLACQVGLPMDPEAVFAEYAEGYLRWKEAQGRISEHTLDKWYEEAGVVCAGVGGIRMCDLTPELFDGLYDELLKAAADNANVQMGFLANADGLLRSMMRTAVHFGILERNPLDYLDLIGHRSELKLVSATKLDAVVGQLDVSDTQQLVLLLVLTQGLSRDRACYLTWDDVDFEGNTLTVHRSQAETVQEPLLPEAKEVLLSRRIWLQAQDSQVLGSWRICSDDGEPMEPSNVARWWLNHSNELGMFNWNGADLQQAFALRSLEHGVPLKTVQLLIDRELQPTVLYKLNKLLENKLEIW